MRERYIAEPRRPTIHQNRGHICDSFHARQQVEDLDACAIDPAPRLDYEGHKVVLVRGSGALGRRVHRRHRRGVSPIADVPPRAHHAHVQCPRRAILVHLVVPTPLVCRPLRPWLDRGLDIRESPQLPAQRVTNVVLAVRHPFSPAPAVQAVQRLLGE
jgi:hypothetical protein